MQGEKGEKGEDGLNGRNYTPMIGNTTTLPPGNEAVVTINDDTVNDIIYYNFSLPKGAKGDKGDKGDSPDMSTYPTFNDLENYPTFEDVATQIKPGTIQGSSTTGFLVDGEGKPYAAEYSASQYSSLSGDTFVSVGTLNVVRGGIESEIETIRLASDVVDIVSNYAALQAYPTTSLTANDLIKVLQDETHSNALSYYRWVITGGNGAWSYVGSEGPFYTKSEADGKYELTSNKVTSISGSSTDTQYPSAKCVYDIVGNIIEVIDEINGEVI